ncbi:hypothetical protein OIU85_007326 [Salix viminalis]|uniref:Uncharacterized protein n=1 Tax=Salix viminalis TaxID=40686 RepID=A0A9Q0SN79_SALVM|nr:hypothetical protein OIU85_007326 [Salix viminalis]
MDGGGGGGGGGCGRVVHLEFLDVFKESGHPIKFHLSIHNFYNLLFKIVHPEVGGTELRKNRVDVIRKCIGGGYSGGGGFKWCKLSRARPIPLWVSEETQGSFLEAARPANFVPNDAKLRCKDAETMFHVVLKDFCEIDDDPI